MTSFFDEISRNRLKSVLLLLFFSVFFVLVIYVFSLYLFGGGTGSLILAVVLTALYAIFVYSSGDRVVLRVSNAKKADPDKYPVLFDTVEGLAMASQLKTPDVYIIEDPSPNAFATGRNKNHASIAVTTGLLSVMSKAELEGVIAHEMSHVSNNDIQFMLIAVVFAGAIGLFAAFIRNMFWFGMSGREDRNSGGIIILAMLFSILAPIIALLVRLAISRRREYMSFANGGRLTRAPQNLANALKKIQEYDEGKLQARRAGRGAFLTPTYVKHANELTASLYIANPLNPSKFMSNLLSTHPPIQDRIDKLERMY